MTDPTYYGNNVRTRTRTVSVPGDQDNGERWFASPAGDSDMGLYGATRLIAAMRLHVIRKLGETAEVPEELA